MDLFTITFLDTEDGGAVSVCGERTNCGDIIEDGKLVGTWMECRDLGTGVKVRYEVREVNE